mmetsp:Transcript_15273/g.15409  ORF Transcript_15273/g.15409 Transcript_15273/m.15409 type:complete len:575 (+) Transcript_15273:126-1850(+)|eukprot:CAMPEP_0182437450 /NCGR_PEP_ID=MMETSP1167-20130531/85027_1 /TAXON_ID=2988 /ORGANISM="Mallomonas Sp, Strain CCMP3275" /LENGTH=574 /DNA_ID=CAMNT_0024630379 /DNA_START=120 /DNA_END=1844 /DNA_ORIENTATION=-
MSNKQQRPSVGQGKADKAGKKLSVLGEIQKLEKEREERRKRMGQKRENRAAEEQRQKDQGLVGDVDFTKMIREYRHKYASLEQPHSPPGEMKICVCVRKRPINSREIKKQDHDSITVYNPVVVVHDCKMKVDGITKILDNTNFEMDHTFHENDTTDDLYYYAVQPLVHFVLNHGRATVFAYGQTGSGKTYTMMAIQKFYADDLFAALDASEEDISIYISFFEIYGGRCQDLLNERHRLSVLEDAKGEIQIGELTELQACNADDMSRIIDMGNANRTTTATEMNDVSSRSHAICQVMLKNPSSGKLVGKLSLIDLAGSERGSDTKSHNRQLRMEGAEINKSLLALKECIRALGAGSSHVPYRASKLTLVLKDSFTRAKARTVMIATVSPAASYAETTLNTLRYADRIKERKVGGQAAQNAQAERKEERVRERDAKGEERKRGRDGPAKQYEEEDDLNYVYDRADGDILEGEDQNLAELSRTVQGLFDEEEALLNTHMSVIQENAELLTEEGRLLQHIQGEDVVDYDIDAYAARLDEILERKQTLILLLKNKLNVFRSHLMNEEKASERVGRVPAY